MKAAGSTLHSLFQIIRRDAYAGPTKIVDHGLRGPEIVHKRGLGGNRRRAEIDGRPASIDAMHC
jgi:hypothetical protein